jgi:ADP-ribosylglycohydrolase
MTIDNDKPGSNPFRVATRAGGYKPFPVERIAVPLALSLTKAEYERLAYGWCAEQGDSWQIVFEEPWLLVCRPAQRTCIYAMRFEPDGVGYVVTEAYRNNHPHEAGFFGPMSPLRLKRAALVMQINVESVVNLKGDRLKALMAEIHPVNAILNSETRANSLQPAELVTPNLDPRRLLGAIVGDVIGSAYEASGEKRGDVALITPYSKFTDDTVMTCAVAEAILLERPFAQSMRRWGRRYPMRGYGQSFERWLQDDFAEPYGSYGNGGAMRASAIGLCCPTLEDVMAMAEGSAECTHNHPEGIKGAQAAALAVWLARNKATKGDIKKEIKSRIGYELSRQLATIRPEYKWSAEAQDSVPEAIQCFLEAENYEETLRNVLSLGGDTDTMGAIAGGIAAAYWDGVPMEIVTQVEPLLPVNVVETVNHFSARYF